QASASLRTTGAPVCADGVGVFSVLPVGEGEHPTANTKMTTHACPAPRLPPRDPSLRLVATDLLQHDIIHPDVPLTGDYDPECDVSCLVRHIQHDAVPRPVDRPLDRSVLHVVKRERLCAGWAVDAQPHASPTLN